jgi:hypothetical protein
MGEERGQRGGYGGKRVTETSLNIYDKSGRSDDTAAHKRETRKPLVMDGQECANFKPFLKRTAG